MNFTGTRIRVAPRVLANQYAKNRAELYMQQRFFASLLSKIDKKEPGVLAAVVEVPGRLNDIRKTGKEAAQQWIGLNTIATNAKAHYRAALQRAVNQLSRRRGDPSRLEAYQALLSGKGKEDVGEVMAMLESMGASLIEKAKDFREARKDKKQERKKEDGVVSAVMGLFDTNGDGRIDDDEIEDAVGRLSAFLDGDADYDEDDDDFGDDDELEDDTAEVAFDDDGELEVVGRGGRGGGGGRGGRGGRGGGRGGRGGFGRHRGHRHHYHGGYWGPSYVNSDPYWDLPEDDIVDTPDGPVLLRRRPIIVRRRLL